MMPVLLPQCEFDIVTGMGRTQSQHPGMQRRLLGSLQITAKIVNIVQFQPYPGFSARTVARLDTYLRISQS